jgi:hypothetical protein
MGSALDYLPSVAMGTSVSQQTGVPADGYTATGYSALIQSVTGKPPTLVKLDNRKAQIILDQAQTDKMKAWLENQVNAGLKIVGSPSKLDLVTGPFVLPVVLKYAVPAAIALFVLGWVANSYLGKR